MMFKLTTISLFFFYLIGFKLSYGQIMQKKKYAQFDSLQSNMTKFNEFNANFSKVDTHSLFIRAKLITTSQVGLIDGKILNDEVLSQNAEAFYSENNPNMVYIFINHSQRYYTEKSDGKTSFEFYSLGCTYLIAYDIRRNSFFKLSGFSNTELKKFKIAMGRAQIQFSSNNRKIYQLIKKESSCNCEFNEDNKLYIN